MSWNSERPTVVTVKGQSYNCTETGTALAGKIKSLARGAGFGNFDVVDDNNRPVTEAQIKSGDYTTPLHIMPYAKAAK